MNDMCHDLGRLHDGWAAAIEETVPGVKTEHAGVKEALATEKQNPGAVKTYFNN